MRVVSRTESGFTLIELVSVIVILGILAATALPKFVNLKSDAELAAVNGVAAALNSGFAINYGAYQVNAAKGVQLSGTVTLANAATGVMVGGMPAGYSLLGAAGATQVQCGTVAGSPVAVTVSNSSNTTNKSAAATLVCTG